MKKFTITKEELENKISEFKSKVKLTSEEHEELEILRGKLGNYEYIGGRKDKAKDKLKVIKYEFKNSSRKDYVLLGLTACLSLLVGCACANAVILISKSVEFDINVKNVENNMAEKGIFENFDHDAINATTENGKFYLNIFGNMEISGESKFVCVNYEINKDLYERILNCYTIEYKCNDKGEITSAKNSLTAMGSENEANEIYKEIKEITKNQEISSIKTYVLTLSNESEAKNSAINFAVREKMPDEITVEDIISEQITGKKPVVVEFNR